MSWTLLRHKNGQEVPIKVSVLDAFRSGSKRGKKPVEKPRLVRPQANTKAVVTPKDQPAVATSNSHSTKETETWTDADDQKLREMKTEGASWKQIVAALGDRHNSDSQAKARWKEIEGKPVSRAAAGVGASPSNNDKKDDDKTESDKKAKDDKNKAEGLAKQAAAKESKNEMKGILKRKNNKVSATSQESDVKSIAAKYEKDKWLAVASRHFDRTGQRISAEMAEAMCQSKN